MEERPGASSTAALVKENEVSHEVDSAMYVRKPAWHRLGNVVAEYPGSWPEARAAAGLLWDVRKLPIALASPTGRYAPAPGYTALVRSDKDMMRRNPETGAEEINPNALLAVQPDSYQVVTNEEFGEVIEYVLGVDDLGEQVQYETLISLYGGRLIVALVRFEAPLEIPGDSSQHFTYVGLCSRHDGNGGLRGIPTNIRIECANLTKAAEAQAKVDRVGFTIRHTSNWRARLEDARTVLMGAKAEAKAYAEMANELIAAELHPNGIAGYLDRFLPTRSDMTELQVKNVETSRAAVRGFYESRSCESIRGTVYGITAAATEWAEHGRAFRTEDSYVARSLLRAEPLKARAFRVGRSLAGV